MSLSTGTRLGPYEIMAPLGAGGMGEVYRARDARLGREVAVKVLPQSFAADSDRLRRFEQEARAVATLNHPNVVAVHDVGEHNGAPYLVSELLEGETLRDKMRAGAISARRAIEYASQIADGLAAAHDHDIIHRDLKPENIFLTRDGRVKILDFGLAKLASAEAQMAATAEGATSAGVTHTMPGLIVGTAGYMSPEQVRGRGVDARTDIFSLGAILYEMLSGQRAFKGDTSVETMNSILKDDPPELDAANLQVSPGLERIVRRCLEKEPEQRFHSARDVKFAMEALSGSSATASQIRLKATRPRAGWWAALGLAVIVAALLTFVFTRRPAGQLPSKIQQITFREGYIRGARFAPDGHTVIYGAMWDGEPMQLYAGRADSIEWRPIDPPNADLLAMSRTGELAVALNRFFSDAWVPTGTLARVPLMGGSPRPMLEGVEDADWSPDGSALAIARRVGGRFRLEYPIGHVLYETDGYISHLRFSPKGDGIAFLDHPIYSDDRGTVAVVDLQGKKRTITPEYDSEQGLAWTPDGREIWYTGDQTMYGVTLNGKVRVVWPGMQTLQIHDISATGQVLLSDATYIGDIIPGTIDGTEGKNLTTFGWASACGLSDDGQLAAINEFNTGDTQNYQIFVRKVDGSPAVDLGVAGRISGMSPDGKWVLAIPPAHPDKLLVVPTGLGETRTIADTGLTYQESFWFPDQKRALAIASQPGHAARTYVVSLADRTPPQPVSPEGTLGSMVSADGKSFLAVDGNGQWLTCRTDGNECHEARGMQPGDLPVRWLSDGTLLLRRRGEIPANVSRLDLASGSRKLWHKFAPKNPAGALTFRTLFVAADQRHYLYDTRRVLSHLFVIDGLH